MCKISAYDVVNNYDEASLSKLSTTMEKDRHARKLQKLFQKKEKIKR